MKNRIVLFFTHPLTLTVLGLVCIILLVWFVGPLVQIASVVPLGSAMTRSIVTAFLVMSFALRQSWKFVRSKRENAKLVERMTEDQRKAVTDEELGQQKLKEDSQEIQKNLRHAIALLRDARLSSADGSKSWRGYLSLAGKRFLYELPWYVFIGAPGSGKTTALRNAGLRFPFDRELGTKSLKGVGGTRLCDWWITDEAVLIDTAGRFSTQDSDHDVDAEGWQDFLKLLRKYRARQPLNGILLTVSASDLLRPDAEERDRLAASMRARLAELGEQLGVRAPVYVMLTKCDLLAGFDDFFAELTQEQREQVWGVTLPYKPEADIAKEGQWLPALEALEQRLEGLMLQRTAREGNRQTNAQIFAFPQQFATLVPVLARFVDAACGSSKLGTPLVRGVYFTSATQEGMPIDRLMGSLARAFRISGQSRSRARGAGRAYFLTRLLRDVIFAERDVGGLDPKRVRRHAVLRLAATWVLGIASVGLVGAWCVSAWLNHRYVQEVAVRLDKLKSQLAAYDGSSRGGDLLAASALLANVREAARTADVDPAAPPTGYRFGLFQGDKLNASARSAYERMVGGVLLPPIVRSLEKVLATNAGGDMDALYDALRAYVMLYEPGHFDAKSFRAWTAAEWERSLPNDVGAEQRKLLLGHLDALVADGAPRPDTLRNKTLVDQARAMLATTPLAKRIYGHIKARRPPDEIAAFTIADAGGPTAAQVFIRASGKPLTDGVAPLYTFDGYHKFVRPAISPEAAQLAREEPWVLGSATRKQDPSRVASDVRALYITDYIAEWDKFLADVRLARPDSLQRNIEVTRELAQKGVSPLVLLLTRVARETTLLPPETKSSGGVGSIDIQSRTVGKEARVIQRKMNEAINVGKDVASITSSASKAVDKSVLPDDGAEGAVNEHFLPLARAVAGDHPPFDEVRGLLTEYNVKLIATQEAKANGSEPPKLDEVKVKLKAAAGSMPVVVRAMIESLLGSGEAVTAGIAVQNAQGSFKAGLGQECAKSIQGRYPFVRSSQKDALRGDFTKLFGPGGSFDEFIQKQLASSVDVNVRPLRYLNPNAGGNRASLAVFESALVIRDVYFPNHGAVPTIRFDVRLVELSEGLTEVVINVDGKEQHFTAGAGLPQSVQWPGPNDGTGVRLQAMGPAGPTGPVLQTTGPWAILRLFESASEILPSGSPERFRAVFERQGAKAVFEVTSTSSKSPFRLRELESFRCAGF